MDPLSEEWEDLALKTKHNLLDFTIDHSGDNARISNSQLKEWRIERIGDIINTIILKLDNVANQIKSLKDAATT